MSTAAVSASEVTTLWRFTNMLIIIIIIITTSEPRRQPGHNGHVLDTRL